MELTPRQIRQAASAAMTKCRCGNVARRGEETCGACADIDTVANERAEIIALAVGELIDLQEHTGVNTSGLRILVGRYL